MLQVPGEPIRAKRQVGLRLSPEHASALLRRSIRRTGACLKAAVSKQPVPNVSTSITLVERGLCLLVQ